MFLFESKHNQNQFSDPLEKISQTDAQSFKHFISSQDELIGHPQQRSRGQNKFIQLEVVTLSSDQSQVVAETNQMLN